MSKGSGRARHVAGGIALGLASVVLTLGVLEVALRISMSAPEMIRKPAPDPPPDGGLPRLRGVRQLSQPNVRGVHRGVLHRTNSVGMRGPEISREKAPGVFRIAITGDSITMGSGVPEDATYPAVVQDQLNAERDDHVYEVLNLGLSGVNATFAVRRLVNVGLQFAPDMIVYGWTINDIEGPHYRTTEVERTERGKAWAGEWERSPSYLWRSLGPRLRSLRELVWPAPGSHLSVLRNNYFQNPDAWAQVLNGLDHLADVAAKRDVCAVVLLHSLTYHLHAFHPFHDFYDAVANAAKERGLYVVVSFPYFSGRRATSLWVHMYDSHPNATGHQLLAQALVDGLDQMPARCWRSWGGHAVREPDRSAPPIEQEVRLRREALVNGE